MKMKKFMILTAMALPLVFAGCNNDDFGLTEQPSQELETVIGAKIASHGMTISTTGADTRLDRLGWEKGDRLGIAWVTAMTGEDITDEQYPIDWSTFATLTDSKIYANHMFEYSGSGFGYYGDVYEGAYFAYWPFTKLGQVGEMEFTLNNEQKIASSEAFYFKNALSISAIDSINARDEIGTFFIKEGVSKTFKLVQVANGISVNTKFVGTEDVNNLKISEVKVITTGKDLFTTSATLNPHKLPSAEYKTATPTVYDAEKTAEKMTLAELIGTGSDKALVMGTAAEEISTKVDMALGTANTVGILTFPTAKESVTATDVQIEVSVVDAEDVPQGKFVIAYNAEADANGKANNDALSKLAALLNGGYTQNGVTYSLQEFNTTYFNIPMNLMMSDFQSEKTWEVADAEGWNKAVAEINALGINSATIALSENLTFSETVNPLFPTKAELTVTGGKAMTIKGQATISKNVKTQADAAMGYILVKGAELTIAEDAVVQVNAITVEGILNVNGTIENDAVTGADKITIAKSASVAGVMNLGAKGIIEASVTITNDNVINVTEGIKNKITETVTGSGKVLAEVTNGANADNIMKNVQATEVTFNGATVKAPLQDKIAYITIGNTIFSGDLSSGTANVALTVKEGTLTFDKGTKITLGASGGSSKVVTVEAGAKMVIATGLTGSVITYSVKNNGIIDLQKDADKTITTWKTGNVEGDGSINLNGNTRTNI